MSSCTEGETDILRKAIECWQRLTATLAGAQCAKTNRRANKRSGLVAVNSLQCL